MANAARNHDRLPLSQLDCPVSDPRLEAVADAAEGIAFTIVPADVEPTARAQGRPAS